MPSSGAHKAPDDRPGRQDAYYPLKASFETVKRQQNPHRALVRVARATTVGAQEFSLNGKESIQHIVAA
jgi:hypothetical protein